MLGDTHTNHSAVLGFDIVGFSSGSHRAKRFAIGEAVTRLRTNYQFSTLRFAAKPDTGDGFFATLDTTNIAQALDFLKSFEEALADTNSTRMPESRIKVRAALHIGAWSLDHALGRSDWSLSVAEQGTAIGPGINETARYLDSGPLREFVKANADRRDFVFGISREFYEITAPDTERQSDFAPYEFDMGEKNFTGKIYLYAPEKTSYTLPHRLTHNRTTAQTNLAGRTPAIDPGFDGRIPGLQELNYIDPTDEGPFVGRAADLEKIRAIVSDGIPTPGKARVNLVSIHAIGGAGKTRLLFEGIKQATLTRFSRCFAYCFYTDGASPVDFLERLSRALSIEVGGNALNWLDRLADCIAREPTLLALDGIEVLQNFDPDTANHGKLNDAVIGIGEDRFSGNPLRVLIERILEKSASLILLTSRISLNYQDVNTERECVQDLELRHYDESDAFKLFRSRGGKCNADEFHAYYTEFGGHPLTLVAAAKLLRYADEDLNGEILIDLLRKPEDMPAEQSDEALKLYRIFRIYFVDGVPVANSRQRVCMNERQLRALLYASMHTRDIEADQILELAAYASGHSSSNYSEYVQFFREDLEPLARAGLISEIRRGAGQVHGIVMHPLIREILPVFSLRHFELATKEIADHLINKAAEIPGLHAGQNSRTIRDLFDQVHWHLIAGHAEQGWDLLQKHRDELQGCGYYYPYFQIVEKFYREIRDHRLFADSFELQDTILSNYFRKCIYLGYAKKVKNLRLTLDRFDFGSLPQVRAYVLYNCFKEGNIREGKKSRARFGDSEFDFDSVQSLYETIYASPDADFLSRLRMALLILNISYDLPPNDQVYMVIARIFVQLGQREQAETLLKEAEAVESKGETSVFSYQMQYFLTKNGRTTEAGEWRDQYRRKLQSLHLFSFFHDAEPYLLLAEKKYAEVLEYTIQYDSERLVDLDKIWELMYYRVARSWALLHLAEETVDPGERTVKLDEVENLIDETLQRMEYYECYFDVLELRDAQKYLMKLKTQTPPQDSGKAARATTPESTSQPDVITQLRGKYVKVPTDSAGYSNRKTEEKEREL